jgi:DNA-binding TFAR19-related protein (PDSD5 family)
VTYVLESGAEGGLHIDHVLEYNEDPRLLSELLTHQLTVEARKRIERARLSRREIVRRMRTSLPQLYRLLDPANTRKSINQLVALLHVLGCDVDVTVRRRQKAA